MPELLLDLVVLASDEFVPPDDWRAQIALPVGILFLLGGVFMLLRSNLGTRRAYLVQATSFFGFMLMISLFWAFGAPGTPPYSGPANLPGQPLDYYQPKWVEFAPDSLAAEMPAFDVAQDYPDGWSEEPPGDLTEDLIDDGIEDIRNFFASEEAGEQVGDLWVPNVDETPILFAESDDGRPMMAVEYVEADALGEVEDPDNTYLAFGFFDEGFPLFPSLVFIILSGGGFALHLALLGWDERQERRELEEDLGEEAAPEKVPAGV